MHVSSKHTVGHLKSGGVCFQPTRTSHSCCGPNIKNDNGFEVHKMFLPFLENWNHAFHFEKLIKFVLTKYNSIHAILKSVQC